jgi:hypothetical protein
MHRTTNEFVRINSHYSAFYSKSTATFRPNRLRRRICYVDVHSSLAGTCKYRTVRIEVPRSGFFLGRSRRPVLIGGLARTCQVFWRKVIRTFLVRFYSAMLAFGWVLWGCGSPNVLKHQFEAPARNNILDSVARNTVSNPFSAARQRLLDV